MAIDKSTKYCELHVFLKNGQKATGMFHVPMRTSSQIRPSDAIQEKKNGLLLLTQVTLIDHNVAREIPAILMPYDSISYIELPAGWTVKEESECVPAVAGPSAHHPASLSTPAAAQPAHPQPPIAAPHPPNAPAHTAPPVPRWMPQRTPIR